MASDEEKEAAYRFRDFLAQPEDAATFMSYDGAPSALIGVERLKGICAASGVRLTREEWYELYLAAGKQLS